MKETKKNSIQNAATALILLKEWLSISESQICSTEVLSEQLPKINELLESSMNDISEHFGILASDSREIGQELDQIDHAVNELEIDGKIVNITTYIHDLAKNTKDKKSAKELDKLAQALKNQKKDVNKELKKAHKALEEMTVEVSRIVVGMQFQDRVSQNIVITVDIMRSIAQYLDREIENSIPNITREERKKLIDKEFAKKLLEKFRLGELQLSFVNHLVEHGYIDNAEELGFSIDGHAADDNKSDDDGIDLF